MGIGYKHDSISITTFLDRPDFPADVAYSTSYKDMDIFQLEGIVQNLYKNFLMRAKFDYGWILSGDGIITLPIVLDPQTFLYTHFFPKAKGHEWDLEGFFGYSISLYKDRLFLTP